MKKKWPFALCGAKCANNTEILQMRWIKLAHRYAIPRIWRKKLFYALSVPKCASKHGFICIYFFRPILGYQENFRYLASCMRHNKSTARICIQTHHCKSWNFLSTINRERIIEPRIDPRSQSGHSLPWNQDPQRSHCWISCICEDNPNVHNDENTPQERSASWKAMKIAFFYRSGLLSGLYPPHTHTQYRHFPLFTPTQKIPDTYPAFAIAHLILIVMFESRGRDRWTESSSKCLTRWCSW